MKPSTKAWILRSATALGFLLCLAGAYLLAEFASHTFRDKAPSRVESERPNAATTARFVPLRRGPIVGYYGSGDSALLLAHTTGIPQVRRLVLASVDSSSPSPGFPLSLMPARHDAAGIQPKEEKPSTRDRILWSWILSQLRMADTPNE